MSNLIRFRIFAALALIALALAGTLPAQAQSAATFTVTSASGFLRSAPSTSAARVYSVYKGQAFAVTGRTGDNAWLNVDFHAGEATWIYAALGTVIGDLNAVPVSGASSAPAAPAAPVAASTTGAPATPPTGGVTLQFTVTMNAFARSAASRSATKLGSLFKGQRYAAIGRSPDYNWVLITFNNGSAWVGLTVGALSGSVASLPVSSAVFGPETKSGPVGPLASMLTIPPSLTPDMATYYGAVAPDSKGRPALPPWIPTITTHMRQLWQLSGVYGNNPNAFAIAGDCNSEHYLYLERIAGGLFDLGPYPYLSSTKDWFYPSFLRSSQAVNGGFASGSMFDPLWGDPKQCRSTEGPFACELRVTRASIVFIALGTGDHFKWREFEPNYRAMIDYALSKGVLPVLVTKGDNLEYERTDSDAPSGYINDVIRRLGQEYDLPVLDLWAALQPMYHHGLMEEDGADFHLSGEGTWVHILTTLQTLDVIRH